MKKTTTFLLCFLLLLFVPSVLAADKLTQGFANPPDEARPWVYWWWLNSNITPQAITRDLEELKEKGFGGALIFDADGSNQDGNRRVPAGPMFSSPEWTELFLHAINEADRLGLSLSLNILSGWNLGGPFVTTEHSAKHIAHSATDVEGGRTVDIMLPKPPVRLDTYTDITVLAIRGWETDAPHIVEVKASSSQSDFPPTRAVDGDPSSYWVAYGYTPAHGPTPERPQWLEIRYSQPIEVDQFIVRGRANFGPTKCILYISEDGETFQPVREFTVENDRESSIPLTRTTALAFRLVIHGSYDPRNVQIADMALLLGDQRYLGGRRQPMLDLFAEKILIRNMRPSSAPDCRPLMFDEPEIPGEVFPKVEEVICLAQYMDEEGRLRWEAPEGQWIVLRFGYTPSGSRVSTASGDWQGLVLDYLCPHAFDFYWERTVRPLLDAAGPAAGRTLRYLHHDSWECGAMNWSPTFREEFINRRGYDPLPYLPIVAGYILTDRMTSNRFLHDFRRTVGDMIADNHYRRFQARANEYNIGIHPESGGPHGGPFDSLQLLGISEIPMLEFWSWSPRHRVGEDNRFFTKQAASAAHTNSRRLVAAEGFTNIGMHWQESFSHNLKPSFDQAVSEGMNLLVWHTFTSSPDELGFPGQAYFAGTHFNPRSFVWEKSKPFLAYIGRVQFLLQQGLPAADVLEYYGEHVPNFTQRKGWNTARSLPGYDYDVASKDVILHQIAGVRDGKIVLRDGVKYRVLVMPERTSISYEVLQRVEELVREGATIIGPKPVRTSGLDPRPIAAEWWCETGAEGFKGRVFLDTTAHELLRADGVPFAFERVVGTSEAPRIDWIQRTLYGNHLEAVSLRNFADFSPLDVGTIPADPESGFGAEIFFVANLTNAPDKTICAFRVTGRQPEIWDPLTGEIRKAKAFVQDGERTFVPLDFAPYGSIFVVFREEINKTAQGTAVSNEPDFVETRELAGPWSVQFDPNWGGPEEPLEWTTLDSWSKHTEPGIRYYSGHVVYSKNIDVRKQAGQRVFIEFGNVYELAEVRLNGEVCGGVWAAPFRLELTDFVRSGNNRLEVEVVNHLANRIIGDASKPESERFMQTNIQRLTSETPLINSGLIGPVHLLLTAPSR